MYNVVFVDTDAGIEHFGRGVEEFCDLLILVVDPTFESLVLAQRCKELCKQLNKPLYFVLNKITDDIKEYILHELGVNKDRILGIIPYSKEIFLKGLLGQELDINLNEVE